MRSLKHAFQSLLALLVLTALLAACSGAAGEPTPSPVPLAPAPSPVQEIPTMTPLPSSPTPARGLNPVLNQDFPDPDLLQVGDQYFAYATNADDRHVQVAQSSNLRQWRLLGDALPQLPSWAVQDFGWTWAPDVSASPDGAGYILFFVTKVAQGQGGLQCIGLATAAKPEGPFQPQGDGPLVCQTEEGGSIDPATFIDDDGQRYLLWKNDGNAFSMTTWIYIQPLASDGRSLTGEPHRLIKAGQPWEGNLIEAPTLLKHAGTYTLLYSANDYASPKYAIGYAQSDQLLGPYVKSPQPLLATSIPEHRVGPGGQEVVVLPDGQMVLVYHAWEAGAFRSMNIAQLTWQDGKPVVKPFP